MSKQNSIWSVTWSLHYKLATTAYPTVKKEDGEYNPTFDKRFHASGHASREDITWVIDQIEPDHIVPIHTEARDWFAESFENVILPVEGNQLEF